MILFSRFREGIISLLGKRKKSNYDARSIKGGVDAGRDSFVNLNTKENKQKKNLLRKINLYRSQKKTTSSQLFSETTSTRWRRISLLFVCLVVAVGLFINYDGLGNIRFVLGSLGYFHISGVEVEGCIHSSPEKIRNSSRILLSSSLFTVDDDEIIKAVKSENRWVDEVVILRNWPDQVVVQVKDYVPVALLCVTGDGAADLYYMDKKGIPFIKTTAGMDLDFPVMTGLGKINDDERSGQIEEALTFLNLIRRNNPSLPSQSVSEIHVNKDDGLIIHMVEYPFPIFFGSGDVRGKYFKLRKVLERLYKYKPRKNVMGIADVAYIRMDYQENKVLVGYSRKIESG